MSILSWVDSDSVGTHELIDEVFESDYEWAAVGLFSRKSDGALFWATDSGCSCKGQWEDLSEADLQPLTVDALAALQAEVTALDGDGPDFATRQAFVQKAQSMVAGT